MTSPDGNMITHGESLDLSSHTRSFKKTTIESQFHIMKDMARDSAVGRGDRMIVPSTLSLELNHHNNHQHHHQQQQQQHHHQQQPPSQTGDFKQEILELKKEQEMQKQMLLHSFQEKKKQLELEHKIQLEHKYQFAAHSHGVFQELREQQRIAAEQEQQRERREREVTNNNNKRKDNCSANASPEVKQKLQSFLIKKQAASANGLTSSSPFRNRGGVVKSSSGESLPAGSVGSHPYKIPQPPIQPIPVKYSESDFPLRKTASEPNLLKIRLKQSVIERKARMGGPLGVRRQERLLQAAQRRLQKQNNALANCSNTPDSGPNSPPTQYAGGSRGSPTSAPIQEENEDAAQYHPGQRSSINDLTLFTSPSMPNISLGRPLAHSSAANLAMLTALRQQAAVAAAANIQPLIGVGPPTYYNPLPSPFDRHSAVSTISIAPPLPQQQDTPSPPQAHAATNIPSLCSGGSGGALSTLHQASGFGQAITDAQVAQARLNKQGHRPLGRTQSAPLPLGHPMLTGAGQVNIGQTHYEETDAERQAYEQQHLLLTKLRETVLTRSGAISASREPQLKEESECLNTGEVIDLTDKKQPPKTVLTNTVITSTSQSLPDAIATVGCREEILLFHQQQQQQQHEKIRDQEYLQKQRELLFMHTAAAAAEARNLIRPLSRTLSSPLVHLGQQIPDTGQQSCHPTPIMTSSSADNIPPVNLSLSHQRKLLDLENKISILNQTTAILPNKITTGLAYDNMMLKHSCICGNNSVHPEHSGRLQSVWARLNETDLAARCHRLRSRKATQEELQVVHTEAHSMLFGSNQLSRQKFDISPSISFVQLACGGVGVDLDTTWNELHTSAAARMAAGCVIDLAFKTAKGDIKNGFAVVRPPGHHAEANLAMGFCFFNSIAIATKLLLQKMPKDVRRVLIVDWDVHHGNGTQQVFYDSPNVLYLSIHRHDDGNFFPGTGGPTECGCGAGLGFNVNISWSGGLNPPLGDAEYLAAFRTIVMPIAREFNPDIVLVSAGFDAAAGHAAPLGGYLVSPACFGWMTKELMQLADGKCILALEGGYDLPAICDSAQECVKALLGDDINSINEMELNRRPCQNAIDTLQKTIAIQMSHWPCVQRLAHTVSVSAYEAFKIEREESETVTAMAGLSMQPLARNLSHEDSEEPMDQDDVK